MPANWPGFIQTVSEKLTSKTITSNEELATFLSDQYVSATVGKAQSPFGNTHQSGQKVLLVEAFKKGFDQLEKNPGPTFEEKEKSPIFSQLEDQLPTASSASSEQEKEFIKWASETPEKVPDFKFFQFVESGKTLPTTPEAAVKLIAERILFQYDGSASFSNWVLLLDFGYLKDIGRLVKEEYESLVSGLSDAGIRAKQSKIKLSRKIYQVSFSEGQTQIPQYLNKEFIAKFTYTGTVDRPLDYLRQLGDTVEVSRILNSRNKFLEYGVGIAKKIQEYGSPLEGEGKRYFDTLQKWVESQSKEEAENREESDSEDPYEIMAKGVIDYWKSTLQQPLSANPPVPPCAILAPGLGLYAPLSYGSQKTLADFLRRAFNSGKIFKIPGTEEAASKIVATGLAVSFARHLLQLKFIYRGGIATPTGPAPMIGFVPFVF